jgi:acetyltransferase-like isoleucine patch superfamily enzyme
MGRGSYVGSNCYFTYTKIGRYCSIASNVKVIVATHPSAQLVSTHPAFFSPRRQAGFTYAGEQRFNEFMMLDESLSVNIGNDVWIGEDVIIMGGIRIGDGAIVGAKALVTKDVEPYTIVGGVPAKKIRNRFDEEAKRFLLDFKWWEKEESWVKDHAPLFIDISTFVETLGKK